ncbi:MAG TPA: hypothetical protein VF615_25620 [Longimicrobiaceae bacterium]|jgi:hypothetical protein
MILTQAQAEARLAKLPPLRLGCSCCDCGQRRCLESLIRFYGGWVEPSIEAEPVAADAPEWLRDPRL